MVQPLVLREDLGEGLIDRCPDGECTGFQVGRFGLATVGSGRVTPYRVRVIFWASERAPESYTFDRFRDAQEFARDYYQETFVC